VTVVLQMPVHSAK